MRSGSCYQLFFLVMAIARFLMASASFGSSLSTLTLTYVGETAIVEGVGIVRIKLDRQVEVLNGAVNLVDFVVSIATIIEGNGLVRIKLDRLVVVLDGAIILALSEVGVAAIADGFDVVRIEFDCLVVVLDGAVT